MNPELIAVFGLLIGLTLLVVEFFIPSGGLILVLACISLTAGVWGAWKAWGQGDSYMFVSYLGLMLLLVPGAVGGALYLLNTTSLGDRVLLSGPTPEEVAGFQSETNRLRELIGQRGETVTLLNPGGLVLVNGTRYHCESRGMMVDPGREVEVLDVDGARLVVRVPSEPQNRQDTDAADPQLAKTQLAETQLADASEQQTDSFDFDIPEDAG